MQSIYAKVPPKNKIANERKKSTILCVLREVGTATFSLTQRAAVLLSWVLVSGSQRTHPRSTAKLLCYSACCSSLITPVCPSSVANDSGVLPHLSFK